MARKSTVVFLWVIAVVAALGLGGFIYADQTGVISVGADAITPIDKYCTACASIDAYGNLSPEGCEIDCLGYPEPVCVTELQCSSNSNCGDGMSCTYGCCTYDSTGDDSTDDTAIGDDDTSVSDDDISISDDTVSDDMVAPIDNTTSDNTSTPSDDTVADDSLSGSGSTSTNPPSTPGTPPDSPSVTDEADGSTTSGQSSSESRSSSSSTSSTAAGDTEDQATKNARQAAESAVTGPLEIVSMIVLAFVGFLSLKKYFSAKKYHL